MDATGQRQWEHPNGEAAGAAESARFREQMNLYEQSLANYNRMYMNGAGGTPQMSQQSQGGRGGGGMSGMAKGGMLGFMAGSLLSNRARNNRRNVRRADVHIHRHNNNSRGGAGTAPFFDQSGGGGSRYGGGGSSNQFGGRKAPLTDITHRPLTGRRSGNSTTQLVANLTCSAGPGIENSPARGLLEIFAAAQAGSINRKRSLKLISDDSEAQSSVLNFPSRASSQSTGTPSANTGASSTVIPCTLPLPNIPSKSSLSLSFTSSRPRKLVSTLSRLQTFGGQRGRPPLYVSTRFCMLDYISRPKDIYTFISRDATTLVPPFSCAYNNVANEARNLAVGDEDGTIHILDTRKDDAHPSETIQIHAHQNAIFDLCWSKDDTKIISVSGDQTARLHDVETKKCLGIFSGHTGSIKSVSMKYSDNNIFATAARDGAVMIWDVRCSSTVTPHGDIVYRPADRLVNVHASTTRSVPPKRLKHGSDGPNTASAVQYMLHNENIIASTGALDGSVKYWDVRKHGTYFKHDFPTPLQTSTYIPTTKRAHGMTSMALSSDGSVLYAVSSDNNIYMYNTTSLGSPIERFGGSGFTCSSYYIKISISPDGNYIAAGSSSDLYVWEVNRPDRKPLLFKGHEKEVTGVDWAKDIGNGTQLSGCSDDATVQTWKPNAQLARDCSADESLRKMHGIVVESP
ncbi:hypothetical protein BGZ50_009852 [Haplosporangium sp. Z 11]|nr:hypothetical protein BGZ50_009852 [Haplosporangium sp. Z 11]